MYITLTLFHMMMYRKQRKIRWAKLLHFSRFSGVLRKLFREYKCLSLIILNNEYLCTAYGQGNTKIFPQKLQWHWNHEYLAQRIFPRLQYKLTFKPPMDVEWLKVHSKWITVNVQSVWTQMIINSLPMYLFPWCEHYIMHCIMHNTP